MDNNRKKNTKIPTVQGDIFSASLLTVAIILIFFIVFYFFGNASKINSGMISLFGAILAFSGLMTKQYLMKENIKYLRKWKEIERLIDVVTIDVTENDPELKKISQIMIEQNNLAHKYMQYVTFELKSIPILPLLLVVLYGAALIASESMAANLTFLSCMLFLVSYLAKATISSNSLAIDTTELDETIAELRELNAILNEK